MKSLVMLQSQILTGESGHHFQAEEKKPSLNINEQYDDLFITLLNFPNLNFIKDIFK